MQDRIKIRSVEVLSDDWAVLTKTTFDYRRNDGAWETQVRQTYDRGDGAVIQQREFATADRDRIADGPPSNPLTFADPSLPSEVMGGTAHRCWESTMARHGRRKDAMSEMGPTADSESTAHLFTVSEAFRELRTNLQFLQVERTANLLLDGRPADHQAVGHVHLDHRRLGHGN